LRVLSKLSTPELLQPRLPHTTKTKATCVYLRARDPGAQGGVEVGMEVQTCRRVAVSGSITRRTSRLSCRTLRPARPRVNTNECGCAA
jgi:hypothetical protein